MNNLFEELKQFDVNNVLPVICGTTLLKINNKDAQTLNKKENFFLLIREVTHNSKFNLLSELEKWISLNINELNETIFFSIYNTVNRYSALQLMDYFNRFYNRKLIKNSIGYNDSLSELAINVTNPNKKDDTFLDPTANLNGTWFQILKNNPQQRMFLQTVQPLEACWIYLNVKALGANDVKIDSKNVLIEPKYVINDRSSLNKQLKLFDQIITIPPYGMRIPTKLLNNSYNRFQYGDITSTSTEWGFVSNVIASLNNTGKAAITLPNGPLFNSVKQQKIIRNNIINSDKIEAVISFPEKFFTNTTISTNLLIINNNKKELKNKIIFIDANQSTWIERGKNVNNLTPEGIKQISRLVEKPKDIVNISKIIDISSHLDTLMVNKYVPKNHITIDNQRYSINLSELKEMESISIPLERIAHIQPGYNTTSNNDNPNANLKILKISDFNENKPINYHSLSSIENEGKDYLNKYIIKKNDIVFSARGSLGKVAFIEKDPPVTTVISSNLVIIRCKKDIDIDPKWLYLYLKSLLVKYFIEKNKSGATVSILSLKHLKNLPVLQNKLDNQLKTVKIYDEKHQEILKLQNKIKSDEKLLQKQLGHEFTIDKIFEDI